MLRSVPERGVNGGVKTAISRNETFSSARRGRPRNLEDNVGGGGVGGRARAWYDVRRARCEPHLNVSNPQDPVFTPPFTPLLGALERPTASGHPLQCYLQPRAEQSLSKTVT